MFGNIAETIIPTGFVKITKFPNRDVSPAHDPIEMTDNSEK